MYAFTYTYVSIYVSLYVCIFMYETCSNNDINQYSPSMNILTFLGKDNTLRLWNVQTHQLELMKEFGEEMFSVALHPTVIICIYTYVCIFVHMILCVYNNVYMYL
jgi:WD40 repeat protein